MVLETIELLSIKVKKLKKENRKLQKENKALNKELETYKKIAEKLAEELSYTDNSICRDLNEIAKCKFESGKDNRNTCKQCIIDWARKEVEK